MGIFAGFGWKVLVLLVVSAVTGYVTDFDASLHCTVNWIGGAVAMGALFSIDRIIELREKDANS